MNKIRFIAYYGEETKLVELSKPAGGGGGYHIMIDNGYYGGVEFRNGRWVVLLQNEDSMFADDVRELEDLVNRWNGIDS